MLGDAERTVSRCYGDGGANYRMMTFSDYVSIKEGVNLPDRPPVKRLPKTNAVPNTNAHRRNLMPTKVTPIKPTVLHVAQVVPVNVLTKT